MNRGKNPHRRLVGVLPGDLVVHVEKICVPFLHRLLTQPTDRLGKIQIDPESRFPDPPTFVTDPFRRPGGNIPRRQIPVAGIETFQKIVPLAFRNLAGGTPIPLLFGDPHPTVIAQ